MKVSIIGCVVLSLLCSQAYGVEENDCTSLLTQIERSEALTEVDKIFEMEAAIEDLRRSNGRFERRSKIDRDRRMQLLKQTLWSGELSQAVDIFRESFRKVELSYFIILNHSEFFALKVEDDGDLEHKRLPQVLRMESELSEAFVSLGENYVEYQSVRSYLEDLIENSEDPMKFRAQYVLDQLGVSDIAKAFPELGLRPAERPTAQEIAALFWSQSEPIVALLKRDLREERRLGIFKLGLWTVTGFQQAVMKVGKFQVFGKEIGGPRFQTFLSSLFLISRDHYLKVEHLNTVEEVINPHMDVASRARFLLDQCDSRCDELLETFARLGYFTEDWTQIKAHVEGLAPKHVQYGRLNTLMEKAERTAKTLHGLSLDYQDLAKGRARQALISSAAVSFWTVLLTTDAADWTRLMELLRGLF